MIFSIPQRTGEGKETERVITTTEPSRANLSYDGIYDVPKAARYLRASSHSAIVYSVSSRKMINWIRRSVATPALAGVPGRELLIEFET